MPALEGYSTVGTREKYKLTVHMHSGSECKQLTTSYDELSDLPYDCDQP